MIRLLAFCTLLTTLWLSGCSLTGLSAAPIEGRVVDAGTGEPIQGAIVMAAWPLKTGFHNTTGGYLALTEAVTNAKGEYRMAGWANKKLPSGHWVAKEAPIVNVLKPNYMLGTWLNNSETSLRRWRRQLHSQWNKKSLKLERYRGNPSNYLSQIRRIGTYYSSNPSCTAKQLPILTNKLLELREKASNAGHDSRIPGLYFDYPQECNTKH